MKRLILLRHGESEWNKEKRFTGWSDIDLSAEGHREAAKAGKRLKAEGIQIDQAFTSWLKRAVHTLNHVLDELDQNYIPVTKSWRLNERSYGALQGCFQADVVNQYGKELVSAWRDSLDAQQPVLNPQDPRSPLCQPRYDGIPRDQLPLGESLQMLMDRIVPFYKEQIEPAVAADQTVLIAAHGNALGVLMKYLNDTAAKDPASIEPDVEFPLIYEPPTGIPMVYEFDDDMHIVRFCCLGDREEVLERSGRIG